VNSYLVGREPLALCVFLVDARHEPTEADLTLRAYLDHHSLPYVVAATKSDKLGRAAAARRREALRAGLAQRALDVLSVSATTGEGIDPLWRTIREATRPLGRLKLHGH
jgi:GTP-binding protein